MDADTWMDDIVLIPDDVCGESEKNYVSNPVVPPTPLPPPHACLSIKVIYNNEWVRQAGGGSQPTAHRRAIEVVGEAEHIFTTKFLPANRLQTSIEFYLVEGRST